MTTLAPAPASEPAPDGPESPWWLRVVAALPVLVPVMVTALAVAALGAVLLEVYSLPVVLPAAAVLAALGLWVVGLEERRVARRHLVVDVLALALALAFALFNAAFASQNVTITRDPGIYAVTSEWLIHHDSLHVHGDPDLFGPQKLLQARSAGVGPVEEYGHLYFQGNHVVPAVLGVAGRAFGTDVMLRTDALIGGLALLSVYAFGRRLMPRWGALVAAALVGVGLPQIAFSRDTYSEPLGQLFVYGGLALLWQARRGRWQQWLVAGLVLAGACMARIDGFLLLPPLAVYVGLRLASAQPGERRLVGRDMGALVVGLAATAALGRADLLLTAPGYARSLTDEFHLIVLALIGSVVAAVLMVVAGWAGIAAWWQRVRPTAAPRVAHAGVAVVLLVGAAMASRPLWMTSIGDNHAGRTAFVEMLQRHEGEAVRPRRDYYEQSVIWLGWYLGPLCVALALFGMALLVRRLVREGDLRLAPFVGVVALVGGYYLYKAQIIPDQIWAMRRFVPVVLPAVAILGTMVACLLLSRVVARWRAVVTVLTGIALFAPVLYVTEPFLTVRQHVPQAAEVDAICRVLPPDAGVVVVGAMNKSYTMTLRTFCQVPSAGTAVLTPAMAVIARASLAEAGRRLFVVSAEDVRETVKRTPSAGFPQPCVITSWLIMTPTLTTPPRGTTPLRIKVFIGEIGSAGKVVHWLPSPGRA